MFQCHSVLIIVTQDKSAFGGRKDTALRCIEVKLKTLSTLVQKFKKNWKNPRLKRAKFHKSLFWVPTLAAGGPYWVLISQKVGSLLGPYFKAWGSLLVWVTVHTFWKKLSLFGDIIILSFKMITLKGPRCTVDKSWQSAEPPPPSTPLRAFWSFGQAFPPWYASGKWNGGKWRWWTRAVDIGITPWFSLLTSPYCSSYLRE